MKKFEAEAAIIEIEADGFFVGMPGARAEDEGVTAADGLLAEDGSVGGGTTDDEDDLHEVAVGHGNVAVDHSAGCTNGELAGEEELPTLKANG